MRRRFARLQISLLADRLHTTRAMLVAVHWDHNSSGREQEKGDYIDVMLTMPEVQKSLKVSKLPRNVAVRDVEGLFGSIVRIVQLKLLPTKQDKNSCHAIITVVLKGTCLKAIQRRVRKGCFGRKNIQVEVLTTKGLDAEMRQQNTQRNHDSTMNSGTVVKTTNNSSFKLLAKRFHKFLHESANTLHLARCSDREELAVVFSDWANTHASGTIRSVGRTAESICAPVVTALRRMRLMKSKRVSVSGKNCIVCIFAGLGGRFPSAREQGNAKSRVLSQHKALEENKNGISIELSETPKASSVISPGQPHDMVFLIESSTDSHASLSEVVISGPHRRSFSVEYTPGITLPVGTTKVCARFTSTGTGVYRATVLFHFQSSNSDTSFAIARYVRLRSGDADIQEVLRPSSPYRTPVRPKGSAFSTVDAVDAPKGDGEVSKIHRVLPGYEIPDRVKKSVSSPRALDSLLKSLASRNNVDAYAEFWQLMLWASEHQANQDITLFDMEHVKLIREGNLYKLFVPGLAEGRPSVLKGDVVIVRWRRKCYKGRVRLVQLLDVLLEFRPAFHRDYDPRLDEVHVRFTFSRTTFRTSHSGCKLAPVSMGKRMLFPDRDDCSDAVAQEIVSRTIGTFHWANPDLNSEQQFAVENIVKGHGRPLPYVLFGPPGTGKTTTIVEAVYQLSRHSDKLKILLVAPSNDAADILGTKLTQYFPPTELRRILAFSRSVADLPDKLKPHCSEGLDEEGQKNEIMSARIVVGTVNMAARFSLMGVPKGHFNVLVVDEAGHAIEPEVIAVAATLMDYNTTSKKRSGQLLLAGDPKQLGPVISSKVCEKHGLALSYMERLTLREAYGRCGADGQYPPSLLTKLVRNYRSHPAILKLPNTMFYDNELQVCGDRMKTHNLANWEHLPICHFPVLFHAVHGENTREANSPSWFNPHEAETVVQYVNLLVNQSRPPIGQDEIGIITPYARQVQKIRLALKLRDIFHVKVGSVETFQGQERRVIILSTVRAETELIEMHDKKYNLGFVANEKRFNVAVTRAQALLIVIGHPNVLATDKHRWLPLMRHCKENGSWIGQEWNEDEDDEDDIEYDNDVENEVNEETSSVVVEDDDDDNDAGVSHRVAQESVAFINREE